MLRHIWRLLASPEGGGVVAALLAFKLLLVLVFGPIYPPDSQGYLEYARYLLAEGFWQRVTLITNPIFAVRMAGYPAVLALFLHASEQAWPYLIIGLQSLASLAAMLAVHLLGRDLGLSRAPALFAAIAFATSLQLTLDQCILTDSLHASAIVIAVCVLAHGAASGRPLSLFHALSAGTLLSIAFLLRETLQVLFVTLLPLLTARWLIGHCRLRPLLHSLCALLPFFVTVSAYMAWNEHRYGERFITVGPGAPMLYTLTQAATYDQTLFDGEAPLESAARRVPRKDPYDHVWQILWTLEREGYRRTQINHMVRAHYVKAWLHHPRSMLRVLSDQFSENQLKLAFSPIGSVCLIASWAANQELCPGDRNLQRTIGDGFSGASFWVIAFIVGWIIERTVSIVLSLSFAVGAPLLLVAALRRGNLARDYLALTTASLWAMYVGWMFAFALHQLDSRYLAPVIPLSIVVGLVTLHIAGKRLRAKRATAARA